MKLVLTLLVRDEADIVGDTIASHLALGVDQIVATDNGSIDGTLEILEDYRKAGVLKLLHEPPSDFSQSCWVSRMAEIGYRELGADWLIHADADEVYRPATGEDLKAMLETIEDGTGVLCVARHDFVPCERPMQSSPLMEMRYRKARSLNHLGGSLLPKAIHRGAPNVRITQGNHAALSDHLGSASASGRIFVYHYPIRSFDQLCSKVCNIGSGYARNTELPASAGSHNRARYQLFLEGKLREEYETNYFFGPERLRAALDSGELIEDPWLADFVRPRSNHA